MNDITEEPNVAFDKPEDDIPKKCFYKGILSVAVKDKGGVEYFVQHRHCFG